MTMGEAIPALNLFMMCSEADRRAYCAPPPGYTVRACGGDEVETWKDMQVDDPGQRAAYHAVLDAYIRDVYRPRGDLFFRRCRFICAPNGTPVGTCMIWPAYGAVSTVHWLKVLPAYEGRGLGRALLTDVLSGLGQGAYPVYLHTHPSCYRAIKLYADFGYALVDAPRIGLRENDLAASLPILERVMPPEAYDRLRTVQAPEEFLAAVEQGTLNEF